MGPALGILSSDGSRSRRFAEENILEEESQKMDMEYNLEKRRLVEQQEGDEPAGIYRD